MPKAFTAIPLRANQQAKPEDLNDNIEVALEQFNGRLDSSNMPVESVTATHLVNLTDPVPAPISNGATGPTQMIIGTGAAGADVWTPLSSIDIAADTWRRGWNQLHVYPLLSAALLDAVTKEGMLVGCATIDWHRGQNVKTYTPEEGPAALVKMGADWWTEWAVFVNNVMVARSGKIYPRRHTTSLPFSIPVGSQPVRVELRWATNNDKDVRFSTDTNTPLDIFSYDIWIRNQYR